jgi:hypothetical protein
MLSYLLGTGFLEAVTEVLIGSMKGWEQVPYSLRAAQLIRSCRFLSLLEGHWLRFALKQWRYSASYNKSERKWMYLGD